MPPPPTTTTSGRSHSRLLFLSAAFALIDDEASGTISPQALGRFLATTALRRRFNARTCAFVCSWLREQTDSGRIDFGAFLAGADTSFAELRAESARIRGRRPTSPSRRLSRIHSKAVEHDAIEDLFAKYFVQRHL